MEVNGFVKYVCVISFYSSCFSYSSLGSVRGNILFQRGRGPGNFNNPNIAFERQTSHDRSQSSKPNSAWGHPHQRVDVKDNNLRGCASLPAVDWRRIPTFLIEALFKFYFSCCRSKSNWLTSCLLVLRLVFIFISYIDYNYHLCHNNNDIGYC